MYVPFVEKREGRAFTTCPFPSVKDSCFMTSLKVVDVYIF